MSYQHRILHLSLMSSTRSKTVPDLNTVSFSMKFCISAPEPVWFQILPYLWLELTFSKPMLSKYSFSM